MKPMPFQLQAPRHCGLLDQLSLLCAVEDRPPGHVIGKDERPVEGALRDVDLPGEEGEGNGDEDAGKSAADGDDAELAPEDMEGEYSDDSDGSSVDLEETIAKRRGAFHY